MTRDLRSNPRFRQPAPPDAFTLVVRRGRRRRRILLFGSSAGTAAAATVIVLATSALGSGSDSLRTITPADHQSSRQTPAATLTTAPTVRPSQPSSRIGPSLPVVSPHAQSSASGVGTGGTGDGSHSAATLARSGPVTRSANKAGSVCTGDNSGVGGGTSGLSTAPWCVTATVLSGNSGPVLDLQVCRDPAHQAATLTFPSSQEVDYAITDTATGATLWTWSVGQTFADATHSLAFGSGDCYQWKTTWNGRADDGKPVASGRHLTLTASSTSNELKKQKATTTFTR